jgi:hypothetical protein
MIDHDSFTLICVKDVMLFQHGQLAIQVLYKGVKTEGILKHNWVSGYMCLCSLATNLVKKKY